MSLAAPLRPSNLEHTLCQPRQPDQQMAPDPLQTPPPFADRPLRTVVQAVQSLWESGDDRVFLRLLSPAGSAEEYRYRDVVDRALRWSRFYAERGLSAGAQVVVILPHSLDLYAAYLGAMLAGLVPAMVAHPSAKYSPTAYAKTIGQLLDNAAPDLIITYPEVQGQLASLLPESQAQAVVGVPAELPQADAKGCGQDISPDRPAFLQYSSGTTGLKKGVAISHRALLWQIAEYGKTIGARGDDVIVSWLPLYHDMGLICCFFLPLLTGIPVVAMSPFDWVKRPVMLLKAIGQYRGTLCWLPNFAYNFLALNVSQEEIRTLDLSSLRGVVNCSEPLMVTSHERFLARFGPCGLKPEALGASYAMAETTFAITSGGFGQPLKQDLISGKTLSSDARAVPVPAGDSSAKSLVSSGIALPDTFIEIVAEDGSDLAERCVGEIVVRSPSLLRSYHRNPKATAAALRHGRFFTGDLGYQAEGHLFVTGRKKDLIIVAGKNLYPQDIEEAVGQVAGVIPGRMVAFGVPDAEQGTEKLVVLAESHETDAAKVEALRQTIFEVVAAQTEVAPADIRLVAHMWLVKSTSGKLSRGANQQRYLEWIRRGIAESPSQSPLGQPDAEGRNGPLARNDAELSATVTECVRRVLCQKNRVLPPDFGPATCLLKSGLIDSLSIVTLGLELESALKIRLPESLLETRNFDRIADIVEMVRSMANPSDPVRLQASGAAVGAERGHSAAVATGFEGYVSLGFNCEAALQFKRIGYEENGLFSYTTVPFPSLFQLIKSDFEGLFLKENLRPYTETSVLDVRHNIAFHTDLRSAVDPVSGERRFLPDYDFDERYRLFYALTLQHLIKKWQSWVASDRRVLYILKLQGGNGRARALELRRLFDVKYPKHQATILCLQTEPHREPDWQVPGLLNRYLPAFAPIVDAHAADSRAWDEVFEEFPLNPAQKPQSRRSRSGKIEERNQKHNRRIPETMSIAAQLNPSNIQHMLLLPPQTYEWLRFDPNNDCNLHCVYCHNARSKDVIEETTLRQFLEHNVLTVENFQMGCVMEPTLDKRLVDLMQLVGQSPARPTRQFMLQTNGLLLHRHDHRRMLDAGLNYLSVSIDSVNPAIFKSLRGGASVDLLKRNLTVFHEQCPLVDIQVIVTVTSANVDDMEALVAWGLTAGARKFVFREIFYYPNNPIVDHRQMQALVLLPGQFQQMRELVLARFSGAAEFWFGESDELKDYASKALAVSQPNLESLNGPMTTSSSRSGSRPEPIPSIAAECDKAIANACDAHQRGQAEDVRKWLAAARELTPPTCDQALVLGFLHLNLGEIASALDWFVWAVRLKPALAAGHSASALALQLLQRSAEAKNEAEAALVLDANDLVALKVLTRISLNLSRWSESRAYCQKVLAIAPEDPDAIKMLEELEHNQMTGNSKNPEVSPSSNPAPVPPVEPATSGQSPTVAQNLANPAGPAGDHAAQTELCRGFGPEHALQQLLTIGHFQRPIEICHTQAPLPAGPDGFPVPPVGLTVNYGLGDLERYLALGRRSYGNLSQLMRKHDVKLQSGDAVLDWGCAAGRVTRHFMAEARDGCEIWGCDVNSAPIQWAQHHLSPPFKFFNSSRIPHLPFPDGAFKFIFGLSVVTHLIALRDLWLLELRRVLRADGCLVLTVHDESTWAWWREHGMPDWVPAEWRDLSALPGECVEIRGKKQWCSYTFFHSDYIRHNWGQFFEIAEIAPRTEGFQTAVVLRKFPPTPSNTQGSVAS